ncbi:MAG: 2-hydroxyacyl-CoA dehydratase [Acidobacteria bacterium]|nr:2-hydroxyacyl-CoA dehydratase [Acidobacteriota bacterium]
MNSARIGITTTVPIEIVYAAGRVPVDLNNVFITHEDRRHFAVEAEKIGLPRTVCGWNKGILVAALVQGLASVIEVVQGDCSFSDATGLILRERGIEVIPFAYPLDRDPDVLQAELARLAGRLDTTLAAAEEVRRRFTPIRDMLRQLDELTWREGLVSGFENHLYLVSGSDMNGEPPAFEADLRDFLHKAAGRVPPSEGVRLGYVGVPTMIDDLYEKTEALGGRIVFNEVQRQFAMCRPAADLLAQYREYTYPYSVFGRVADIRHALTERRLAGLIHYVQTFCFHHLEDQIFRRELPVPVLTLEADTPGPLSPRDETRLENFIGMLAARQTECVATPHAVEQGPYVSRATSPAAGTSPDRRREAISAPASLRVGIDLGSRWVKLIWLLGDEIVGREMFDTIAFYHSFAHRAGGCLSLSRERLADRFRTQFARPLPADGLRLYTTGYGRHLARFDQAEIIPELEAHLQGARYQLGLEDFTLLDIGGQDTKVIAVLDGRMENFVMNDRCAAGSGRYLENMARLLGIAVHELGLYSADPEPLNATCATFGESEVVGKIVEGVPLERICAGINFSVFQRVLPDLRALPSRVLVVTGGVAHNRAIRKFLGQGTDFAEIVVPPDPQYNGALGAVYAGGRTSAQK